MIRNRTRAQTEEPAVAYLTSRYPALSHTFIEREVTGLRAAGVRVETFTVRPTPEESLVTDHMRSEAARTRALVGAGAWTWLRAHATVLRRRPSAWVSGVARALRTGPLSPKARLWQVFYFVEAVVLVDLMRRRGIRHVHAHFANVASDVARHAAALGADLDGPDAGWRWSFTMHGSAGFDSVKAIDLAAKARSADGVSCISDFCRSQVMALVDPEHWDKLDVVHMTVDAQTYHPPASPRHHDGPLRILDVGRLIPQKGPSILIDAVELLERRGIAVQVRIVGAGPLEDWVRAEVERRGLVGSIELTGPMGQDRLPDLYRWADVFVLPSLQEGLPVVLMEALSTQLPVVTTRLAGIGELVLDGKTGRLVAPGRADLLADAIADLALDPELRARMGEAGRDIVLREFTTDADTADAHRFILSVQGRSDGSRALAGGFDQGRP